MGESGRVEKTTERRLRNLAGILVLAASYFVVGKLGLTQAFLNASASPVWPPTGLALAVLLRWGYGLWPGVFIGAFLVNLTTQGSLGTTLGIATGNTLEAVTGVWLINRFACGMDAFERTSTLFKFVLGAAVLSTTISATLGVTSLCLGGFAAWGRFGAVWLTWWLGDLISALIVAPLLIIWLRRPRPVWQGRRMAEVAGLLLIVAALGATVFFARRPFESAADLVYLTILPPIYAAFRLGRRGAISVAFCLSILALWGAVEGRGPFLRSEPNRSLLLLQGFMGTVALMAVISAAAFSERRRAEEAARRSQRAEEARRLELETLLEAVPAAVLIAQDAQCLRISGNSMGEALLQSPPGGNLSKSAPLAERPEHFKLLINGQEVAEDQLPMQRVGRTGLAILGCELECRFSDGTSRWLYGNAIPLLGVDRSVKGVMAAYIDVTKRKAVEHALEKVKAELVAHTQDLERAVAARTEELRATVQELESFSGSISHDMRGPLRAMQGYAAILLEELSAQLNTDQRHYLQRIHDEGMRLSRLIQDLLHYSQVSRAKLQLQAIDLEPFLLEIVRQQKALTPQAEILIKAPLPAIVAHEAALAQIMTNLLDNAVKFVASRSTPRVLIWAETGPERARIWVEDNGIGIDPRHQERIFEVFEQVDKNHSGTGIGLAIVKRAVERMGGTLGVVSALGSGCRFWFDLPRFSEATNYAPGSPTCR